jgi:uncharacterized protein
MNRFEYHRVSEIALGLLTLALIIFVGTIVRNSLRIRTLTIAAGSSSGGSYIVCNALKAVLERHYPNIKLRLLETAGTVENLNLLERGQADLAAAQADVAAGPSARSVALLYDDVFQLLVHEKSTISNFAGLRGKAIALARGGGQFDSFLRVAEHFNLHENDFQFVGASDADADEAFLAGRADALFRVRSIGNPSIKHLAEVEDVRFVGIEQGPAMKIRYPAFEPVTIPMGAYEGRPATPGEDLPSIAVHRTLLASMRADAGAIRTLTSVLTERRAEIMREIPASMSDMRLLLTQTRRPEVRAEISPPLHPGAASFYNQDRPSFLLSHADFLGLMLSVTLMAASWVWQLKGWMERRKKANADEYSNRVIELMDAAQSSNSVIALEETRMHLLGLLTSAVRDLDGDELSEETFQSFRAILQIALEVAKERRDALLFVEGRPMGQLGPQSQRKGETINRS